MFVMDRSGSMSGSKLADAKTAAQYFVDLMGLNDKAGLASYNHGATLDEGNHDHALPG